jgi:hypothetical protein
MSRMSELEPVTGEIVPAPAADIRYEDGSRVTRVFVRVEWAGGKIREYQAVEPEGFEMNEPESWSSMSVRDTGIRLGAGGLFAPLKTAVSSMRLSFRANPRHNMHIRTEATAPEEFKGITY